MVELARKELCTGCTACMAACLRRCITMQEDDEGFLFPIVDERRCIDCKKCVSVCPAQRERGAPVTPLETYAAQNRQDDVRMHSSSGGVFHLLGELTLQKDGVVFGAAMTEACEVAHIHITELSGLDRLGGSKYLQSRMADTFAQVKIYLEQGRQVLFTGTACQISGLRAFLGRDYDNLLCQDIVCYGVPSPGVWRKYVRELEKRENRKLCSVNFRNKTTGWRGYSVTYRFSSGTERTIPSAQDPFLRGFLDNLYLRRSCNTCTYKNSEADITIGDCWGVEHLAPHMDDERGTSVVIIRTEKGAKAFDAIAQRIRCQQIDYSQAVERNRAITSAAKQSKKRELYFSAPEESFEQTINRLTKVTFLTRWKRRIHALCRRIFLR